MAEFDPRVIIEHQTELIDKIKDWETRPVSTRDSREFKVWQTQVESWLRKGGPATATELAYFMNMLFSALEPQLPGGTVYTDEDQAQYLEDLAMVREHVTSAIETLRQSTTRSGRKRPDAKGSDIVAIEARIYEFLNELSELSQEVRRGGDISLVGQRLPRIVERLDQFLDEHFVPSERQKLDRAQGQVWLTRPDETVGSAVRAKIAYLMALREELERYPKSVLRDKAEETRSKVPVPARAVAERSRRVFIIHGRDVENRLRLERMLKERFRLLPVVLADEPGKSRAIIEKLEDEIPKCGFAFALMTPDDHVKITSRDGNVEEYAQARPNVLFEMGWIIGELGRENLCILYKHGTKIQTDLEGVSRIEFRDNVEEAYVGIERELKGAKLV